MCECVNRVLKMGIYIVTSTSSKSEVVERHSVLSWDHHDYLK